MQLSVPSYLNTIEVLCLLHMEYLRSGPRDLETHFDEPKSSWILSRLEDASALPVVTHLGTIVYFFMSSPQIFKDLFTSDRRREDNALSRIVEQYYLAYISGLSIQVCAHAAAWAVPDSGRPTLSEIEAVTSGLKKLWYENCPSIEKIHADNNFVEQVRDRIKDSLGTKTLVCRTLLLSDDEIKLVVGKCSYEIICLFLANLNRDDELEFALFQRIWLVLSEVNQIDVALDLQKGIAGSRSDALKAWENILLEHGLVRRTSKRKAS